MEPGSARLHLYTSDLQFIRSLQVPGAVMSWHRFSRIRQPAAGWSAIVGKTTASRGSCCSTRKATWSARCRAGEDRGRGLQNVILRADGMIWSSSLFGMIVLFNEDLELLGSLQLELPGMERWEKSARDTGGWPAQVTDIRRAPDGSGLWVFAVGPEERFVELSLDEFRDEVKCQPVRTGAGCRRLPLLGSPGAGWSDPCGMDHFDTQVRPLGDGDLAYDLQETPDGNRRVRVGRLRFTKGID